MKLEVTEDISSVQFGTLNGCGRCVTTIEEAWCKKANHFRNHSPEPLNHILERLSACCPFRGPHAELRTLRENILHFHVYSLKCKNTFIEISVKVQRR